MNWIQWNLKYIRTINSCNNGHLMAFYAELSELSGAFIKRRYLWNIIRGKTFYINAANYVINNVEMAKISIDLDSNHQMDDATDNLMAHTRSFIRDILASEKDEAVRRSFIWRIGKHVPFLTTDMLPYLSKERVKNILDGDWIINDTALEPFIAEIRELRATNESLQDIISRIDQ